MDKEKPFQGILNAIMFAMRATYHTMLKASPSQLVFGRDAILNTKFIANWERIKAYKQQRIRENNRCKNSKWKVHNYQVNDKVLLKVDPTKINKFDREYKGPYPIIAVYDNGTICIHKNAYSDTVNIRNVKPFLE